MAAIPKLASYQLQDNLIASEKRVFLTGTQALVRMLLSQRRRDRANGWHTAGFVSGYRGSPLGGVDQALWRAREQLAAHDIRFVPAINEDLAATMVLGSQQAGLHPDRKVEGVFGMWYGKGPGVDRAGDALHHGHAAGASRKGCVAGRGRRSHRCFFVYSACQRRHSRIVAYSGYSPRKRRRLRIFRPLGLGRLTVLRQLGGFQGHHRDGRKRSQLYPRRGSPLQHACRSHASSPARIQRARVSDTRHRGTHGAAARSDPVVQPPPPPGPDAGTRPWGPPGCCQRGQGDFGCRGDPAPAASEQSRPARHTPSSDRAGVAAGHQLLAGIR